MLSRDAVDHEVAISSTVSTVLVGYTSLAGSLAMRAGGHHHIVRSLVGFGSGQTIRAVWFGRKWSSGVLKSA